VFAIVALAIVLVPTYFVANSLLDTGANIAARLEPGAQVEIPPPSEKVRSWPFVGDNIYDSWAQAAEDPEAALKRYKPQITKIATSVLGLISGAGAAVGQSIFAILIAAIFLGTASGGKRVALAVGDRLGEEMGRRAVLDAAATIGSVAKGVLGVALVQGLAAAIGLFWLGVPAAGLWTVGVMVLAVIQLPPILLLGPICIWVFSSGSFATTPAVIFTIWSLIVSGADGLLKPVFLGRGVEIPMPVILIGAIGGMISMGIIGLFLGAVVLSIGYSLFMAWLGFNLPKSGEDSESGAPASGAGL
jgi:predicted PurR-regulated permease PerM